MTENQPRVFTPSQLSDLVTPKSDQQQLGNLIKEINNGLKQFNEVLTNIKSVRAMLPSVQPQAEDRSNAEIIESKIEKGIEKATKNYRLSVQGQAASEELVNSVNAFMASIPDEMTGKELKVKVKNELIAGVIEPTITQFLYNYVRLVHE